MPNLYDYRIFISHAWKYGEEYMRLVQLLDQAPYFHYYNYSAPKERPLELTSEWASKSEIQRAISNKIGKSQIELVLGGMYADYHDWMQYEVDEAKRMGKPILLIKPWGQTMIPRYLQDVADDIVGWNTDSIVSAFRRLV